MPPWHDALARSARRWARLRTFRDANEGMLAFRTGREARHGGVRERGSVDRAQHGRNG